jgi:alkylated DNA nucleotide flippase Atl1
MLLRQFNFGMASLERVVWSLFDAFDEGQIESYAQIVHSAGSLKSLLSCYVTNMIEREPRLPWSWTLT